MAKAKLKVVEPTPQQQLEAAIAAEASLHEKLAAAEAKFKRTYPGDLRLLLDPVIRFDAKQPDVREATKEKDDEQAQLERTKFLDDWEALGSLRKQVDIAGRTVRKLQTTIAEHVDEMEARSDLARVLDGIAKLRGKLGDHSKSVDTFRGMVERAKSGVARAEAGLRDASAAVNQAMSDGLSDFLRVGEGVPGAEAHAALKTARDQKIQAADELEMAHRALSIAETRLSQEEVKSQSTSAELARLGAHARELAQSIVTTAIPRLLDEARAAQLELEGRRNVLNLLADYASSEFQAQVAAYLDEPVFQFGFNGELPAEHPAAAAWHAAIDRLTHDAGAALP